MRRSRQRSKVYGLVRVTELSTIEHSGEGMAVHLRFRRAEDERPPESGPLGEGEWRAVLWLPSTANKNEWARTKRDLARLGTTIDEVQELGVRSLISRECTARLFRHGWATIAVQ